VSARGAATKIRPARAEEAATLTELALRSKAVWQYDAAFMAQCRAELTMPASEVLLRRTQVAEADGAILGFVTVCGAPPEGELGELYVEPAAIGGGVGRALLDVALGIARRAGFTSLAIHADPNAEAFYLRHGAKRVGSVPSGSIAGRMLPLLRLDVRPE
jgi:GNAT superfamily N-acetyltransferase